MTDLLDKLIPTQAPTETQRILSLPVDDRQPEDDLSELVDELTGELKTSRGSWELLPVQALSLDVARKVGGLVGNITVGGGKTLLTLLLPRIMGADPYETVLLIPSSMRGSIIRRAREYREHFNIMTQIHVVAYEELSSPEGGRELLSNLRPNLIIADEAHWLRHKSAARTDRFLRYFKDVNPHCHFCAVSGTLTSTSIKDYAHLVELALREGTPLPRTWSTLESWSMCIDVDSPIAIPKAYDWEEMQELEDAFGDGVDLSDLPVFERKKQVREAFYNRLSTTPGIVQTHASSVDCSLYIDPITDVEIPEQVQTALEEAAAFWVLPEDEEIDDPLDLHRSLGQLACGFYYRWIWPDDEKDFDWLYSRSEYRSARRNVIRYGRKDLDSPALVERAIMAGEFSPRTRCEPEKWHPLMRAWVDWQHQAWKPEPPREAVWISDYLLDDAIKRAKGYGDEVIIWYTHREIAKRLEDRGVFVCWPEGVDPETVDSKKHKVIACSSNAHRKGKHLTAYGRNIVLCPSSSGSHWEQLAGRTHRQGQERDEVWIHVYAHTGAYVKSLLKARIKARYAQETLKQPQKFLYADWIKSIDELTYG